MARISRRRRRAPVRRVVAAAAMLASTSAAVAADVNHQLGAGTKSANPVAPLPAMPVDPRLQSLAEDVAKRQWLADVAVHRDYAARVAMWDRLAQCETGGNWNDGGQYGGGLGIYQGTWHMYGGKEFAPRPQDATKDEQIVVAERIALDGMGGWGCARALGLA